MTQDDMSGFSMLELFRMETETQAAILNENLLVLENKPNAAIELEALMRAAHSIKGAARIVQLEAAVEVAHAMEDCFVAAQQNKIAINSSQQIDTLLQGVDLLQCISKLSEGEAEDWSRAHRVEIEGLVTELRALISDNREAPQLESLHLEEAQTLKTHRAQTPPAEAAIAQPSSHAMAFPFEAIDTLAYRDASMLDLFRQEVEHNVSKLREGLFALQAHPASADLTALIHSVYSIKGAAQIVQIDAAVRIARPLQNYFNALQEKKLPLDSAPSELLQGAVEQLASLVRITETEMETWTAQHASEIDRFAASIAAILSGEQPEAYPLESVSQQHAPQQPLATDEDSPHLHPTFEERIRESPKLQLATSPQKSKSIPTSALAKQKEASSQAGGDRVVRVSADNLNRLMGLAGESLVEANWLQPFADSLLHLKKTQSQLAKLLENLHSSLARENLNEQAADQLEAARQKASECSQVLSDRLNELERFARRSTSLSDRLYREVIASHMRPFADGVQAFPRLVRDTAKLLRKQVKFEVIGKSTPVDRDILQKLEAPLTHLLQNAIDHGIELPENRLKAGKSTTGKVTIEAAHRGGMLSISITDDGRGIDLEKLRQKIVNRNMVSAEIAASLSEPELMDFLFLPGFSTASQVTEISGRGVGLDVVQNMVQEVGGILRAVSQPGKGMSFHLQLPLTLSVIRTLLVEIAGEPYAFPLARIDRIAAVERSQLGVVENRQYFQLDGENIGLVSARQIFGLESPTTSAKTIAILVLSDRYHRYGLVVDRFLDERDLVVRPLDSRLGKVPDISAVALMGDGFPILIVDVEDMIRSTDKLLNANQLHKVSQESDRTAVKTRKRILAIDDSITVREVERKLLENQGYQVDVAVNGIDGWNAIRANAYDLVITDVDMPRMTGIELVAQIKNHPTLHSLPVIIVSYKDREEDRLRGLEAGADCYLTKSSFHDDTLINAVIDAIGEA